VPNEQTTDMWSALKGRFPALVVDKWIMTYAYDTPHDHAYKYWHATNDATGSDGDCVSDEVINFLTTH